MLNFTIKYSQTEKGLVFNSLIYGSCFLCLLFATLLIITFPIFSAFFA